MAKFYNKKIEELDLTRDELKDIGDALKKEEFRKLLSEYVNEVTDPENRALFEKEFTELEKQRGVDVTFIHPEPGYVIKTSVDGVQKAFINICSNDIIDKPAAVRKIKEGVQGSDWSVPYILTPPKVDLDKKGQRCVVYDVVFNPLSLEIAKSNPSFKSLINDTAISGIEDSYQAKVDRNNIKFPRMTFKGPKMASIIRKKSDISPDLNDGPLLDIPNYPYAPVKSNPSPQVTNPRCTSTPGYTIPSYVIKHRKGIDLQEYANTPDAKLNASVPSELVVEVDLPLLKSSTDAVLDVSSRNLSLLSEKPSKYKLEISLPYCVDESNGSAKFDKQSKKLIVNLPVVQRKFDHHYLSRDDSGIESDPSQNRSSSDEDLSNPKVEVLNSFDRFSNCPELDGDTRLSAEVCDTFMSEDIHYTFPPFTSFNANNSITMTLNVKNVDPTTLSHQNVFSGSGIHFKFSSLGAGGFPIYYAFCVQFQGFFIKTSTLNVEVWDNNLIINMDIISENVCVKEFLVGTSTKALQLKYFDGLEMGSNEIMKVKSTGTEDVEDKLNNISIGDHINQKSELQIEGSSSEDLSIKDLNNKDPEVRSSSPVIKQAKVRAVSESDILPPISESFARRSILKKSRSLSESHSDEYTNWSSLDSSDITEDSSLSGVKKTVRFSDVISKKVFRANSSILGQKHKNEKKSRNRKKMARRRLSGSENSSDVEFSDFSELEASDYSEVSDVSDLSEASDASSDDLNPPIEVPSSKRHRRRGSKNSRKNANTAKQNSFILYQD